jgi:hypothetical protein
VRDFQGKTRDKPGEGETQTKEKRKKINKRKS